MLPDTETRSATVAALNTDIESLRKAQESLEVGPMKEMFEATIATLILGRDEMIEDDALVDLAQCCARACFVSRNVTKGRGAGGLSEPAQKAIESLKKIVLNIESEVAEHAPSAKFLPGYFPGFTEVFPTLWKVDLQKASEDIDRCMEAEASPVSGEGQCVKPPANDPPPSIVPTRSNVGLSASAELPDSGEQALRRLTSGATPREELVLSIEAVFSSEKAIEMVHYLQRSEAEAFVEAVYQVLGGPGFPPHIRDDCLESLYMVCARHRLLPRSLQISLYEISNGVALYDWKTWGAGKREYRGQQVGIKVMKAYQQSNSRMVPCGFFKKLITWKLLRHPNVLPLLGAIMSESYAPLKLLATVSEWMPNGNIKEYVKAHESLNWFELLRGVAEGLIYMHERGMVHGDLRGANIFIDEDGHARLAGFELLEIVRDTATIIYSTPPSEPDKYRWMSPELLDPEQFSLKHSCPTEHSDCYALGMVVYEVLSGNAPFHYYKTPAAIVRILRGERPVRPQGEKGAWFNEVWHIMEGCWKPSPRDRSKTKDVLLCLEKVSGSWSLPQVMNSDSSPEGSTDESQVSSPSHATPSWSLSVLTPLCLIPTPVVENVATGERTN